MKNQDIYTFQRNLFIKKTPIRMSAWAHIRTHIRMDQLIDIGSALGLLALVVLALAW